MLDASNFKVVLNGRVLCADGDSIADLSFIYSKILNDEKLNNIFVSRQDFQSDEVQYYNSKFPSDKLDMKKSVKELSLEWDIPKKYKELDVKSYVAEKLKEEFDSNDFSLEEKKARVDRVNEELKHWKKRNLTDMLRTLIYIVNTFEEHKVVWGTGRGSSCASYVLYLIGLHQVDSVLYDVDIAEFFR